MKGVGVLLVGLVLGLVTTVSARERVLLPIAVSRVEGGASSSWSTSLVLVSSREQEARGRVSRTCPIGCGDLFNVQVIPQQVDVTGGTAENPGRIIHFEEGNLDLVHFALRLGESSNPCRGAATTLPVVREAEFRSDRFILLHFPEAVDGFRNALRIYSLDPQGGAVRVRFNDVFVGGLIEERVVMLQPGIDEYSPSYAAIFDFPPFPPSRFGRASWVEVEPLETSLRVWAFGSITSPTQQVTLVLP